MKVITAWICSTFLNELDIQFLWVGQLYLFLRGYPITLRVSIDASLHTRRMVDGGEVLQEAQM